MSLDQWRQVSHDLVIPFSIMNWFVVGDDDGEKCQADVPYGDEVDEFGDPEAVGPCDRDGYALVELATGGVTLRAMLCEYHHELLLGDA